MFISTDITVYIEGVKIKVRFTVVILEIIWLQFIKQTTLTV